MGAVGNSVQAFHTKATPSAKPRSRAISRKSSNAKLTMRQKNNVAMGTFGNAQLAYLPHSYANPASYFRGFVTNFIQKNKKEKIRRE